jgi:mannose-1-phosphate guanylyltransferase/mannose-6-phosphate isomerase
LNFGGAKLDIAAVTSFVEKPDRETAQSFVSAGYLWNSGMFVFRADIFMEKLARYQPDISAVILNITDDNISTQYEKLPSLSMDNGLVELADKIAVVPVDMAWSDLGNWDSIYQRHTKDGNNNVTHGGVVSTDTNGSLLWSETGILATLGVNNLVVIQTADATLICDRSRTEDMKLIVDQVKLRYPHMAETHLVVQRPWGSYCVLEEGSHFKIKRIIVTPGAKLSLQTHECRSEHWVVVSGTATVTHGNQEIIVSTNESTYIPAGCLHRLSNNTGQDLVVIEVQTGANLSEDDIVRYGDVYGRI